MQLTHYTVSAGISAPLAVAHVSDLHGRPTRLVSAALQKAEPDIIAITGDLFDRLDDSPDTLPFLQACAALAPTIYTYGNHERTTPAQDDQIRACGVTLLQNEWTTVCGLTVGGLASGFVHGSDRLYAGQPQRRGVYVRADA